MPNQEIGMYSKAAMAIYPGMAPVTSQSVDRENHIHYGRNNIKRTAGQPLSTFSIGVDTASYDNVRRMLAHEGHSPPSDTVHLKELVNYFSYSGPTPESEILPFGISTRLAPAPWIDNHQLLQIDTMSCRLQQPEICGQPRIFNRYVWQHAVTRKIGCSKKSLRLLIDKMAAGESFRFTNYPWNAPDTSARMRPPAYLSLTA